ncbi:UNVERIFIED_CONTAM: hypothetical protein Cloal_2485 [Acetivibrio alkalicellulosi]
MSHINKFRLELERINSIINAPGDPWVGSGIRIERDGRSYDLRTINEIIKGEIAYAKFTGDKTFENYTLIGNELEYFGELNLTFNLIYPEINLNRLESQIIQARRDILLGKGSVAYLKSRYDWYNIITEELWTQGFRVDRFEVVKDDNFYRNVYHMTTKGWVNYTNA